MRIPVLLTLLAAALTAQPLSFGIKAGVPFIDPAGAAGESRDYSVGGAVELRLPAGFAVEGSALYRRLGTSYMFLPQTIPPYQTRGVLNRIRGNSWEFPLLGKYYFRPRRTRWQPFLGAGFSTRTIGYTFNGTITTPHDSGPATVSTFHAHSRSGLAVGMVAAAGVRVHLAGRAWIVPEFRVTRWGTQDWTVRRNDPALYLGFTF